METRMTLEEARRILGLSTEEDRAAVLASNADPSFEVAVIDLTLTTAQDVSAALGRHIRFPFRSIFVRSATDASTAIRLRPNTLDSAQGDIILKNNDSLVFPRSLSGAFISWDAQASKTMQLVAFVTGEFRSGSQVSNNSGGVSINEGSAILTRANTGLSFTNGTAAILLPADPDRKCEKVTSYEGSDFYLGDANVTDENGANPGEILQFRGNFEWRNTSALYAIQYSGGTVTNAKIARNREY